MDLLIWRVSSSDIEKPTLNKTPRLWRLLSLQALIQSSVPVVYADAVRVWGEPVSPARGPNGKLLRRTVHMQ